MRRFAKALAQPIRSPSGTIAGALKEKEAACAALGEVTRNKIRALGGVKAAVDREQKRVKC